MRRMGTMMVLPDGEAEKISVQRQERKMSRQPTNDSELSLSETGSPDGFAMRGLPTLSGAFCVFISPLHALLISTQPLSLSI